MATAESKLVDVPQPPIKKKRVLLELSENEANALALLVAKSGGDPNRSYRKYTQSILKALANAGYGWSFDELDKHVQSNSGISWKTVTLDPSKD